MTALFLNTAFRSLIMKFGFSFSLEAFFIWTPRTSRASRSVAFSRSSLGMMIAANFLCCALWPHRNSEASAALASVVQAITVSVSIANRELVMFRIVNIMLSIPVLKSAAKWEIVRQREWY